MMQTDSDQDKVCELLAASLEAWRLPGTVARALDGAIIVACGGVDIRIERAPHELPFRWLVTAAGRRRGAISLVAVLRQLRAALDPDHAADRVRVVASPLVPS
jgi:hypothetical protein